MEKISSINIKLETADDVEFIEGEDVTNLHMSKAASGIEVSMKGDEGDVTEGFPWGSIKAYSYIV